MKLFIAALMLSSSLACADATLKSSLSVVNSTRQNTVVYVSFGADSVVLPPAWPVCKENGKLNCSFPLKAGATQSLPTIGHLNATLAFGATVSCGSTKAELNINNPAWYDIMDISLVDGFSNKIKIMTRDAAGMHTFAVNSKTGNEKAVGVFPFGCDICTARQNPPCGIGKGTDGCKAGTQYKPDVICQYQGPTKGGGSVVVVTLVP